MSFGGFLKQSTAVNVIIGPFVSSADGDTEMTALTIAQADVRLSKNAAADAQKNDATSCAHEGDGFYMCELDATDLNTVGILDLWVHVATALAIHRTYQVLEEAIYDALYASGATGLLPANVIQISGVTTNVSTMAASVEGLQRSMFVAGFGVAIGATGNDATHIHIGGTPTHGDDELNDHLLCIFDISAQELHSRWIEDFVGATDLATVDTLPFTPQASTDLCWVLALRRNVRDAALGAVADAAADGDPTSTDTLMAYVKQIVNTLVGSAGIPTFPAAAAPGNAVSLSEVIRQLYDEVAGLNGGALLDGSGVRTALGLGSANLDTQLDTLIRSQLLFGGVNILSVGGTGNDVTHVHLEGAFSQDDEELNDYLLIIHDVSEDEWHSRWIEDWVLSTELATVDTLPFTPATTDEFLVLSRRRDVKVGVIRQNTAAAGGAATITLDAGASANDDIYNGYWIKIVKGTGSSNQPRAITDYVGSTQVATVDPAWDTQPDNTSEFAIFS